jgi:hypothetical protein
MELQSFLIGAIIGILLTVVILAKNFMNSMDKLHELMKKFEGFSAGQMAEYGVVPKVKLFNKSRDVDR